MRISPRTALRFSLWLLLPILTAVPVAASGEADEPRAEGFSTRVDVTAVELRIDVRDKKGQRPTDLSAADFEVLEDGEPVRLVGLDYPSSDRGRGASLAKLPEQEPGGLPALSAGQDPWRIVIYVDRPLSARLSILRNGRALAKQAEKLTALGAVEIVLADPMPEVLLPFTRDAAAIEAALQDLVRSKQGTDVVAGIRNGFLNQRQLTGLQRKTIEMHHLEVEEQKASGQILAAARQEWAFCRRQLGALHTWMSNYPTGGANALFLLSDGFDLNPADFYLDTVWINSGADKISQELENYRFGEAAQEIARGLADRGWVTVSMAPEGVRRVTTQDASERGSERYRAFNADISRGNQGNVIDRTQTRRLENMSDAGSAAQAFLLESPLDPLKLAAEETGGEVWTDAGKAKVAIEGLGQRLRLAYEAQRPADGQRHRLEVKVLRPGLEVRAPRWIRSPTPEELAANRARRLLAVPGDASSDLPLRSTFQYLGTPREDGSNAKIRILVDLNALRGEPGKTFPLRVTLAVATPGAPPFVQHVAARVQDQGPQEQAMPASHLVLPLTASDQTRRVAIVVEELSTGTWASQLIELAPAADKPET